MSGCAPAPSPSRRPSRWSFCRRRFPPRRSRCSARSGQPRRPLSFLATGLLLEPLGWRGAAGILGGIALLALPVAIASTRGIAHIPGERAHLDLRVLRNAPLVRTIAAYTGHSWELFIVRAWLAAFLAAAFTLRGLAPTEASATASQWAALMLALGVPGVFLGGWASDRVGRTKS